MNEKEKKVLNADELESVVGGAAIREGGRTVGAGQVVEIVE